MQMKPKKHNKDRQILKKHVSAIHIGAKLSLLQRKLVNALLYNAYDRLLTEKDHTISSALLCEMIGFDSHNTAYLKASLRGLMETVVEFDVLEDDGKSSWEAMTLLSYARIRDGVCTYKYEQALAEKLFHPGMYSKINLSVLREMQSAHALVLYENCYRYVDIGHTPWWDVDVFRKLMSVDEMVSYKQFKLLNRAVIQPAMKEVSELSNITLELETSRRGRSVTGLRFLIQPNRQLSLIGMEEDDDINKSAAYQALIEEGISKTLARAWVLEHDEAYIFEKLEIAHSQAASGKIKSSKTGFLKSAIEEDYHNENAKKKKQLELVQNAKTAREKLEAELEALKAAQREAETAYRWHVAEIIEEAFQALPDDEKSALKAQFETTLTSSIYRSAFQKGGWKDRLTFPDITKFWEARGLALPSPAAWAVEKGSREAAAYKADVEAIEEKLKTLKT
jgi:plasmid replication initiation protein